MVILTRAQIEADETLTYCKCGDCGETFVAEQDDEYNGNCIYCGQYEFLDEEDLLTSEIMEIEKEVNSIPLYQINEGEESLLICETDTPEVQAEIIAAAAFQTVFEHGQWYVKVCDQTFAVVDTNDGIGFELL